MQVLPLGPQADAIFCLQNVRHKDIQVARAVASSLLFRYARLVSGVDPTSPAILVQTALAEWLLVVAGLQDGAGDLPAGSLVALRPEALPAGASVCNSPREFLRDTDTLLPRVRAGNLFVPLAAAVAFLVRWFGSVHPLFQGCLDASSEAQWARQREEVSLFCPSHATDGSPISKALAWGLELEASAFVACLNRVLRHDADANPSPVRVLVLPAHGPLVRANIQELQARLLAAGLAGASPTLDAEVRVPSAAQATPSQMEEALSPEVAVLVQGPVGELHCALNLLAGEAPLEYLCVEEAVAVLSGHLPDLASRSAVESTVGLVWRLFPSYPKERIQEAVRKQAQAKYGGSLEGSSAVSHTPQGRMEGASTLSAAVRRPRRLRPGRWFTKSPSSLVQLVFPGGLWEAGPCVRARGAIVEFLAQVRLLRHDKSSRTFLARGPEDSVLFEATKGSSKGVWDLTEVHVPPQPLHALTGLPTTSVHLDQRALLWLAAGPEDKPKRLLLRLWNDHHIVGRMAEGEDDRTANALAECCAGNPPQRGTRVSLLFRGDDKEAEVLVKALEELMAQTSVGMAGGRPFFGRREGRNLFVATAEITLEGSLSIHPPKKMTLDTDDTSQEALPRGFCLSTAQLAVLFCAGAVEHLEALSTLVRFCRPDEVGFGQEDKDEVRERLQICQVDGGRSTREVQSGISSATFT